jgi:hypothetical protein
MHSHPEGETGLAAYFKTVVIGRKGERPTREVEEVLANNQIDAVALKTILHRSELARGSPHRNLALDLLLNYIRHVLDDRAINAAERDNVRMLRRALDVEDGELMRSRPNELAVLLGEQLDRVLYDGMVNDPEELLQVELQAAVGIGYDDYLSLIRPSAERVYAHLRSLEDDADQQKARDASRKLRMLEQLYLLVIASRGST